MLRLKAITLYILFMTHLKLKDNKGFTLIEIIIYIGLFSLLLGTAFIASFELINGSNNLSTKNTTQDEGNFVLRKIDWASNNALSFSTAGGELTINKYDLTSIKIKLGTGVDAGKILINSTGSFLPITTDNVNVSNLTFTPTGTTPPGITVVATIDGVNFSITKYIRK